MSTATTTPRSPLPIATGIVVTHTKPSTLLNAGFSGLLDNIETTFESETWSDVIPDSWSPSDWVTLWCTLKRNTSVTEVQLGSGGHPRNPISFPDWIAACCDHPSLARLSIDFSAFDFEYPGHTSDSTMHLLMDSIATMPAQGNCMPLLMEQPPPESDDADRVGQQQYRLDPLSRAAISRLTSVLRSSVGPRLNHLKLVLPLNVDHSPEWTRCCETMTTHCTRLASLTLIDASLTLIDDTAGYNFISGESALTRAIRRLSTLHHVELSGIGSLELIPSLWLSPSRMTLETLTLIDLSLDTVAVSEPPPNGGLSPIDALTRLLSSTPHLTTFHLAPSESTKVITTRLSHALVDDVCQVRHFTYQCDWGHEMDLSFVRTLSTSRRLQTLDLLYPFSLKRSHAVVDLLRHTPCLETLFLGYQRGPGAFGEGWHWSVEMSSEHHPLEPVWDAVAHNVCPTLASIGLTVWGMNSRGYDALFRDVTRALASNITLTSLDLSGVDNDDTACEYSGGLEQECEELCQVLATHNRTLLELAVSPLMQRHVYTKDKQWAHAVRRNATVVLTYSIERSDDDVPPFRFRTMAACRANWFRRELWLRFTPLIAFVRADPGHPFALSVVPILRTIRSYLPPPVLQHESTVGETKPTSSTWGIAMTSLLSDARVRSFVRTRFARSHCEPFPSSAPHFPTTRITTRGPSRPVVFSPQRRHRHKRRRAVADSASPAITLAPASATLTVAAAEFASHDHLPSSSSSVL